MKKVFLISLRFFILATLLLVGTKTALAWVGYTNEDGIEYVVYITGEKYDAVADSAYVAGPGDGFTGVLNNIPRSITYEYSWEEFVGYNEQHHPIYTTITRQLTAPVAPHIGDINSQPNWGDYYGRWQGLTSINIPSFIEYIGPYAFFRCPSLEKVTINGSPTIHSNAFWGCSNLTDLTFTGAPTLAAGGDSFKYPDEYGSPIYESSGVFRGCTNLKNINLGSINVISSYAFYCCSNLENIDIPQSVTYIGDYAFSSYFTSITIPKSVTYIGLLAFPGITELSWNAIHCETPLFTTYYYNYNYGYVYDASSIEYVTIGNEVEYLPSGFISGSKIKEITIPNSVTTIGSYAFSQCDSLSSITIPNSVSTIGERAFGESKSLKTIYWDAKNCMYTSNTNYPSNNAPLTDSNTEHIIIGDEVESIDDYLLHNSNINTVTSHAIVPPTITSLCFNCYNSAVLEVPEVSLQAYQNAEGWKCFSTIVAIEGSPIVYGDVDGDGNVSINDVTLLIDLLLNGITGTNGDVNQDGTININDVTLLIDKLLSN